MKDFIARCLSDFLFEISLIDPSDFIVAFGKITLWMLAVVALVKYIW
jgi:hypothetical protein